MSRWLFIFLTVVQTGLTLPTKTAFTSSITHYLVDDLNPTGYAQVLAEYGSLNNPPNVGYVYGLGLISQKASSGNVLYYGYDGQGSVRMLINNGNTVEDTYDYDGYGNLLADSGTDANNYRYLGQQWDPNLSLYYLRARYYDPKLSRFWTMDSYEANQENPLSLNKYLYCQANPANGSDLSGYDDGDVNTEAVVGEGSAGIAGLTEVSTAAARLPLAMKIAQSAGLFAFLVDAAGGFDFSPQSQVEKAEKENPGYMVFLHATSTGEWPQLLSGALPVIDPSKGAGDFGTGFYTFNASGGDVRVLPTAIAWANRIASFSGGEPEVTIWLIAKSQYNQLSKFDFTKLSALQYSTVVGALRFGARGGKTGFDVALGEIAKLQGGAWVRNFSMPLQYKFETSGAAKKLRFLTGFSPQPSH